MRDPLTALGWNGRRQRLIIGWIITSALNFLGINVSVYDFVVLYGS